MAVKTAPVFFVGDEGQVRLAMSRRNINPQLDPHVKRARTFGEIIAGGVGTVVFCSGWGRTFTFADRADLVEAGYKTEDEDN